MATKLKKMADELNEEFRVKLAAAVLEKFDIEIETNFNIMSMRLVTTKKDKSDFTPEQHAYISIFSEGYEAAMFMVRTAA